VAHHATCQTVLTAIVFFLFGRVMTDCVFVARCNALVCFGMGMGSASCFLLSLLYYAAGPPTAIKASNAFPMSPKGLQFYLLSLEATRTFPVSRDVFLSLLCPHHSPPFHGGHPTGGTSYIRWYCNFHCQARQLFPRWSLTVCEPGPELDRVGIVFRIVVDF
jgi:hypothetical protein